VPLILRVDSFEDAIDLNRLSASLGTSDADTARVPREAPQLRHIALAPALANRCWVIMAQ
jgi:hypothetical protein